MISRSGVFDAAWYAAAYATPAIDALDHYIERGAAQGCWPCRLFDPAWYLRQRPDAAATALTPLGHYLKTGWREGASPSVEFDAPWYLSKYPDVATRGIEPLGHYMRHGQAEGRRGRPSDVAPKPVLAAQWRRLKPLSITRDEVDLALFVTHAPHGRLKPHVALHAQALRRKGFAVAAIAATDALDSPQLAAWAPAVDGLYVRANEGFDFAAWAHAARDIEGAARARSLLLVNDSVVGPLNAADFDRIMARLDGSKADLVGLTDNRYPRHHVQSYFLYAKNRGVAALLDFLGAVQSYADKDDVIDAYEVPLLQYVLDRGLNGEALFRARGTRNESVWRWRELLEAGMPYVKVQALRGIPGLDNSGWREALARKGYDPAIAQAALDITAPTTAAETK